MKVSVKNNHVVTDYYYSPEHKADLIGFYTAQYWANKIQGFVATMDDGSIVAIGAN